ncbi:two component transcriptional regulator, winged helix family [Denitrovibrio acetiphilus DSM 12809]|uniref:Phosphate regulon transcriptional regulatory protein PhoB n=1 Tax=Denitrovibrio acetiphilus (strain DSM 12809 / NBRC 114555 / N2460) TaxID=522772 RepID=D4H1P5_DENA2|nr:response regulator transcription factor [Denitrovibrio acetiphilus]ADD68805.1 two component transcriptional regulator, winged helix family [Denitrovibrio acetiphilus DSM 12809]
MNKRILIIEDEEQIALLLKDYLSQAGFEAHMHGTGKGALETVEKISPDAVILDIMLPEVDGLDICRGIRKKSALPIIMLTAKVEEIDRLIGLELGADDYICKPFSPREVVARLKAVLRRTSPEKPVQSISIGSLTIYPELYKVSAGGEDIVLTRSEFMLLLTMAKHPGVVYSRSDLISSVHGYEFEGYERTVDSHIKNLRKKLSEFVNDNIIHTIYGVGYKIEV